MTALNPTQRDELVTQLKTDYQRLLKEVHDELDNDGNPHRIDLLNREPGDRGDESVANALADFSVAIIDRHVHEIRDIEAAIKRVKDAEYGICIDCGEDVGFPRLKAYPTAKRCIACQEKRERGFTHDGHPKL